MAENVECHFCAEEKNFLGVHQMKKSEMKLEEILLEESGGKREKVRNRQTENFNDTLNKIFNLGDGDFTKKFYYLALDKLNKKNCDTDLGR